MGSPRKVARRTETPRSRADSARRLCKLIRVNYPRLTPTPEILWGLLRTLTLREVAALTGISMEEIKKLRKER